MTTLDRINTEFTADGSKFNSAVDRMLEKASGFSSKLERVAKSAALMGGAAAVADATALTAAYLKAAESADKLAKSSDKIGIATEKLVGLRHAAEMSGVSSDKLDQSLVKMSRGIAEAAHGTGKASEYLERFGLANQAFFNQTPDQQFAQLADKINTLGSQQEKAAASAALFGDRQASMLNVIADGSAGLAAMQKDAESLGIALSRVDAAKFEAANDAMERSGKAIKGIGNQFAVEVAPLVEGLSNAFTDAAISSGGLSRSIADLVQDGVKGFGWVADSVKLVEVGFLGIGRAILQVNASIHELDAASNRFAVDLANKIPFAAISLYDAKTQEAATSARNAVNKLTIEIDKEVERGLPSDRIVKWAEDVQKRATAAAEKVAADRAASFSAPTIAVAGPDAPKAADDKITKIYEQSRRELDALREKNDQIYEETLRMHGDLDLAENFRYEKELERNAQQLEDIRAKGVATEEIEQEFRERDAILADQHLTRLAQIKKKEARDAENLAKTKRAIQVKSASDYLSVIAQLSAGAASEYKVFFRLQQVAAISSTMMNTIDAAQASYKWAANWGGPAAGAAAAGIAYAAGIANVMAIKNQQFGGDGGSARAGVVPGASVGNNDILTSAPSVATNPQPVQSPGVIININGNVIGNSAEKLVDELKELMDRDYVFINANTAQARALKRS